MDRRRGYLSGGCQAESAEGPVAASVRAYSRDPLRYKAAHAEKMASQAERFARALAPPARILDAGCGPGRDLARFKALGHRAFGVDLSPEFAQMASHLAPVLVGDLRDIAGLFRPGSFDGIWACASLVHLNRSEATRVLLQFRSLMRPSGILYACVSTAGVTGWLSEDDGRRWYYIWGHDEFAGEVLKAGFDIEEVVRGAFVEVWARAKDEPTASPVEG